MDVSTLSTLIVFLYWFSSNVDGNYALFLGICRYRSLVAKVNYQVDKGIWDKIKVIYFNNRHVIEIGIANSIYGVVYFCFDQLIVLYHVNINVEIDRDIISWDWITLVCLMFTVTWTALFVFIDCRLCTYLNVIAASFVCIVFLHDLHFWMSIFVFTSACC